MAISSTTHPFQYDAVVIGGGSAGLQAALTLGRVHRRTLLLDAGHYRNDPAHHMHNFLGHDGTPPSELRAAARAVVPVAAAPVRPVLARRAPRVAAAISWSRGGGRGRVV